MMLEKKFSSSPSLIVNDRRSRRQKFILFSLLSHLTDRGNNSSPHYFRLFRLASAKF